MDAACFSPTWQQALARGMYLGVFGSVEELMRVHDEFWVMGGAAVYTAFLPYAGHIVRTRIDLAVPGDTFAPRLGPEWQLAAGAETRTSDTGVQYTVEELISGRA
jgi:dihydrofolate reductase